MSLDVIIVVGFLVINLAFGLSSSRGVNNIKEYAVGNRNFATATIVATIIATWIGGSSFSILSAETVHQGVHIAIPSLAEAVMFFIIAYFLAPRMGEFLGNLSVAEAMGNLYGKHVRTITAISGIVPAIGIVAMQFTILSTLLSHFLGISAIYAVITSCVIVITYTASGGIKAVTFTDIIQFFTFGIILPMTVFMIWKTLDNNQAIFDTVTTNPIFDYHELINYHNPNFFNTILLFLYFIIPVQDSAAFQRIAMAKDTSQITNSFKIAGFFFIILDRAIPIFVGILLLADNASNLDSNNIAIYIIDNYLASGFKGAFVVCIIAMIMSTADSYINASAVLLAYDLPKSTGIKLTISQELLLARIASIFVGVVALILSLYAHNLLALVLSS